MDTLLCLCHFCELHGPNVILTTRCVSQSELSPYAEMRSRPQNGRNTSSLASSMSSLPSTSMVTDNSNLFNNEIHLLSDESTAPDTHHCDGCSLRSKSMVGFKGFLSLSSDDKLGFITNSYPSERHDGHSSAISNAIIRDACIRSLSCEVYDSGEGEGLIYFGDDQRAHILSHLFVLRDSKARGFQRTYSILVMSRDKQQLLSDWDFYVKSLQQIVSRLKNKSKIVYESELIQTTCQQRRSLILDNVSNARSLEDLLDRNRTNSQRTNSKARSLLDLTGDNTTFAILHIHFAWILYSVMSSESPPSMAEFGSPLPPVAINEPELNLRTLYKLFGKDKFLTIGYHTVIGNQVIVVDNNQNRLKAVVHCISQLLPEACLSIRINVDNFEESAKHNLIGIATKDQLPSHVMESDFHVVITMKDKTTKSKDAGDKSKAAVLEATKVVVHSNARLPERVPNFLANIENILLDFSYSDATFNSYLFSVKNEWLTRAQTLYSYTKGVNPPRSQTQISALFRLIQSEDCDVKLLNFWSNSGLKYEYKSRVFSINSEMNSFN